MTRWLVQIWALIAAALFIGQGGCGPDSSATKKSERGQGSTSPALMVPSSDSTSRAPRAKEHYLPSPSDFRTLYDRDIANKAKQNWEEYYSWIKTFYSGNFFESGWTKRAMAILEG